MGVGEEKEEGKVADPFIGAGQRSRLPDTERSHSNIMCICQVSQPQRLRETRRERDERSAKFIPQKRGKIAKLLVLWILKIMETL